MKKSWKTTLIVLVVAVAAIMALALYVSSLLNSPAAPLAGRESLEFEISQGESIDSIGRRLFKAGLLNNPLSLKLAALFAGGSSDIKAGVHNLGTGLNAWEIYGALKVSPPAAYKVLTVPEGLDSFEIADIVQQSGLAAKEKFLEAVNDSSLIWDLNPLAESLEGYLFPDTYHVPGDFTARDIVEMMLKRFRQKITEELLPHASAESLALPETVILASLVAKEAAGKTEMPLIASVFHNRLRIEMKLDCDPTFIYAGKLTGDWDGTIDQDDIKRDSPYNTYIHGGLPPGPIGNPGLDAMIAALQPQESDYLYFVARSGDRTEGHHFSKTYSEHLRAVNNYRKNRGHSRETTN